MPVSVEKLNLIMGQIDDSSGRPFSSLRDSPTFAENHLPDRDGYITNINAFKEHAEHKQDAHQLISYLRTELPEERLTVSELLRFSRALYCVPVYLALRAHDPVPEDRIPPSTIDLSRSAAGIMLVANDMKADISIGEHVSPDDISAYASGHNQWERNYFLSAVDLESCPAPLRVVKNVILAMMDYPQIEPGQKLGGDWKTYMTEEDRAGCLLFGPAFISFTYNYMLWNTEPTPPFEERKALDISLQKSYEMINFSLGYTK